MGFQSLEEALTSHGYGGQSAPKVMPALEKALANGETIQTAALAMIGTPQSSGDPVGLCAVSDQRIIAAYKPPGLLARPHLIERGWKGLFGTAPAHAAEMPAVLAYHDAGNLFVSCEEGREDVRESLFASISNLLYRHLHEFAKRHDVAAWIESLGREDRNQIMSSHGYATIARSLSADEPIWAVMPASFLEQRGVFTITEWSLFFVSNDGSANWLLSIWPGGLAGFQCTMGASQLTLRLVPGDPEQVLAGTEMKSAGVGYEQGEPVEIQLGRDTSINILQECEALLNRFLELPPSPK